MASLQTRITYKVGGDLDKLFARFNRGDDGTHRSSVAARRMLLRYQQMLEEAREPLAEIVTIVGQAIKDADISLLFGDKYPDRSKVMAIVAALPIHERARGEIMQHLEVMGFGTYARLIEAIEMYYQD